MKYIAKKYFETNKGQFKKGDEVPADLAKKYYRDVEEVLVKKVGVKEIKVKKVQEVKVQEVKVQEVKVQEVKVEAPEEIIEDAPESDEE